MLVLSTKSKKASAYDTGKNKAVVGRVIGTGIGRWTVSGIAVVP
jgi:hypothetical protein